MESEPIKDGECIRQEMEMAQDIVGSKMKASIGYGNATYLGPASDTKIGATKADMDVTKGTLGLDAAYAECDKRELRKVGGSGKEAKVATTFGMKDQTKPGNLAG